MGDKALKCLCPSLSVCLSVCLRRRLSLPLSLSFLLFLNCLRLSVCFGPQMSFCLSLVSHFLFLSVCLCLSDCLPFCPSVSPSLCQSSSAYLGLCLLACLPLSVSPTPPPPPPPPFPQPSPLSHPVSPAVLSKAKTELAEPLSVYNYTQITTVGGLPQLPVCALHLHWCKRNVTMCGAGRVFHRGQQGDVLAGVDT